MVIYQLTHGYWKDDYEPAVFQIGYYTSRVKAERIRRQYQSLPGFSDHPEGFQIQPYILRGDYYESIWAVNLIFEKGYNECIPLGVFENREIAEKYLEFYRILKGEDVARGQFMIEEHRLNQSDWVEGFCTLYC